MKMTAALILQLKVLSADWHVNKIETQMTWETKIIDRQTQQMLRKILTSQLFYLKCQLNLQKQGIDISILLIIFTHDCFIKQQ